MEKALYFTSYAIGYWGWLMIPGVLISILVYFLNKENKIRNALIAGTAVTIAIVVLGAIGSK